MPAITVEDPTKLDRVPPVPEGARLRRVRSVIAAPSGLEGEGFPVRRAFAGVDARGRTLLVTVDGRQEAHLGLSIPETADVERSLGMVDAVNLDGGGSTAMAIGGQLVSSPSDAAGERAVGDAIVVR